MSTVIFKIAAPVVAITVVGFFDFISKKVYKTKSALNAAHTKRKCVTHVVESIVSFPDAFAKILKAAAIKERLAKAKKFIKVWTFARYIDLLNVIKEVRLFNSGVEKYLKIKI